MKINIIQTITNILDENRQVIKTSASENYILYPEVGKVIKNIITGQIYTSSVSIGSKANLKNYEEIDVA
jgi:hypothetical protein